MEFRKISAVLLFLFLIKFVDGAHILALFSSLSFSDHQVFRGYITLLAQRGHSIVMMTAYPGHFQPVNTDRIVELDVGQESAPFWDEYKMLLSNTDDYYPRLRAMNEFSLKLAIAQLRSKQMTALFINPNIKFDLVITEADVPVLYAVADKYQAPHITITTSSGKIHQFEAKGAPANPFIYPDVNSLNYGDLNCWQRVSEFRRYHYTKNEYYGNFLPLSDLAAKKIFGLKRDLQEVEKDIAVLLIASSPLLVGNRPVVPAISYVDRMHIKPGLNLPQELKELLDRATNGVIFFSLGAIQESESLSPQLLQTLTDAFRELPYLVLWKIANITMINKPDNVVAAPWFPQQQVLVHPNTKAFITHGGARSLEEAIFYQVPIIGLPIIQSRKLFIREVTKHGAGEILDSYYLDKDTATTVITNVATNQSYKDAMINLQKAVIDPIVSGPENALLWTDYVLKNRGARQLRSPVVFSSFYKDYLLDLISCIAILVIIIVYFAIKILSLVVRKVRGFNYRRSDLPASKYKSL